MKPAVTPPKVLAPSPDTVLDVRFAAQKIAFAPIMFQAARLCRDMGILTVVEEAGERGLTTEEIAERTRVSIYGIRVLTEAALSMNLVKLDGERFVLDHVGYVLLHDEMTRVNMDFTHDVCYAGFEKLDASIRDGRPAGLEVFGSWPTVYEGLSQLPEHVQKSWFSFDHYYSDGAFPAALPYVFQTKPKRLLDVGGNTGRFSLVCAAFDPNVRITILDLPGQLEKARANIAKAGLTARIEGVPLNLLDHSKPFPKGYDVVWMSQFLCCFPESDVVELIRRAGEALAPGGAVYILDTYWDRQPNPVATYCLHATSLYFTAIANGTSRMYHSKDLLACVEKAGLRVAEDRDGLSVSHTLWKCVKR
jgi:SAM-dependent methyltransferase